MLNRKVDLIKAIEEKLIQWDSFIKLRSRDGLYDLHKYSENNVRDILNVLYGYRLENVGSGKPNFPVIDLGDTENGLCFQVTSNKTDQAYAALENRFLNSKLKLKEKYPKLHVFILSGMIDDRKGLLKALDKTGLTDDRLLDFNTILVKIRDLSNEENPKLDKILQILDSNYICYQYLDSAIVNYRTASAQRFSEHKTFTPPHIIKTEQRPLREENNTGVEDYRVAENTIGRVSFEQAHERSPQFILTGEAGSGKSEVLRNAFRNMVTKESEVLPIYIDLSKKVQTDNFIGLIHSELRRYIGEHEGIAKGILVEEVCNLLLHNKAFFILLDGYDEMSKSALDLWNENIRSFLALHPGTKLVLAVRRNRILQDIVAPINDMYTILPFDNEQIEKYIEALLIENGQIPDRTKTLFVKNRLSQSKLFLTAPTLIVKMLIQYASVQGEQEIILPNTKSDAYRRYFEYVVFKKLINSGIDNPKALIPELYDRLIHEVFSILSCIAFNNFKYPEVKKAINYSELNIILSQIEDKNRGEYLYQKGIDFFVNELQVIRPDNDLYYFNHFTYQEFFFAFWLKDRIDPSSPALRWAKSAYIVAKYNQVFLFLAGLLNEDELNTFFGRVSKWPVKAWMFFIRPLERMTLTKFYFILEMASEGNIRKSDSEIFTSRLLEELDSYNDINFERTCRILSKLSPGSEAILKKILNRVLSNSTWVRKQGLKHYVLRDIKRNPEFKRAVFGLLDAKERYNRDIGIEVFKEGGVFDDDVVSKVLELHFLPEDDNENEGFRYMTEFSKQYPLKCIDYAKRYLERVAVKNPKQAESLSLFLRYYFAHVMNIPGYHEEEIEKEILSYLKFGSEPLENQSVLIRALYKTGVKNETLLKALLKHLYEETPLATPVFMYYRDLFVVTPEIIEQACRYLYSEDTEARRRAMNYLARIRYDGYFEHNRKRIRIADRVCELVFKSEKSELNQGTREYAVEYLANIGYLENNTTNLMIEKLNDQSENGLHSYILRYLMNVKFYSPSFLTLMFNLQNYSGFSWEADQYFENIEKYIPRDKVHNAREHMLTFFLKDSLAMRKKIKRKKEANDWTRKYDIENYFKRAVALQKIVLYEDESVQMKKVGLI
jgi:hypothetical protein